MLPLEWSFHHSILPLFLLFFVFIIILVRSFSYVISFKNFPTPTLHVNEDTS
ncbi:hypothetical protein HanXRQr2_Chr08g0319861 [Helianthus annuus]|uniref:Uncharacterized protein n=1 Tax=Helianthus annuus TaxID=4232 RepID=A0A9K3IBP5_HELAN|nr:hypothetical protein HanXRQr2_Chr08g0319861 [Helianthus annuus]